jgi:hypothetical protein
MRPNGISAPVPGIRYDSGGMRKTRIVATLALTLALSACGGTVATSSKTPSPSAVASAGPSPTAAPPASPVAVPPKPATLAGYASTVAAYLTASPPAATNCLADLMAAWQMPLVTATNGCRVANTDDEPDNEVVAVLSVSLAAPAAESNTQYEVVVFQAVAGAYTAVFVSPIALVVPARASGALDVLVGAGDLLGPGKGAFAYRATECGASTCVDTVRIVAGSGGAYAPVTPADGVSMAGADVVVKDVDGDGVSELIITGGIAGSVGGGPQRPRTETWKFDGRAYALDSTTFGKPDYLYHAIKDADAFFVSGNYAEAASAYITAVNDKQLKIWMADKNERNELESYALFRAALAILQSGGDGSEALAYLDQAKAYPDTLHAQLAKSFEAAYSAKSSVSVGCGAVRDDLDANSAEYATFWDFGYSNPGFDAATVCPF